MTINRSIKNLSLKKLLLVICLIPFEVSCSTSSATPQVHKQTQKTSISSSSTAKKKTSLSHLEVGHATYYAERVNGRKTASGEIFHNKKLTAAHKHLPFGTKVKVTALWNNKSVIVKINDRGPYGKGRVIDLSQSAASQLGLIGKGVGQVKLEIVKAD